METIYKTIESILDEIEQRDPMIAAVLKHSDTRYEIMFETTARAQDINAVLRELSDRFSCKFDRRYTMHCMDFRFTVEINFPVFAIMNNNKGE